MGGDAGDARSARVGWVSIHAPRVGGDPDSAGSTTPVGVFQSTPPAWGATGDYSRYNDLWGVSIHAPRVGGDSCAADFQRSGNRFNPRPPRGGRPRSFSSSSLAYGFNPRPPRGGRPPIRKSWSMRLMFQSTPPAWGATEGCGCVHRYLIVSIHAPRVGGDIVHALLWPLVVVFQSTPPAWGATI